MNERIKELAEQATEYQEGETEGKHDIELFDKEKFAELIVEEMYDFILDESSNDNGIPDLGKIKQHFGVE